MAKYVDDNTPDLFNFAFSNVNEFSFDAEKFQVVLGMVGSAINNAISKISAAYKNRIAAEVLFYNARVPTDTKNNEIRDIVWDAVSSKVGGSIEFDKYYPQVYLSDSVVTDLRFSVCDSLKAKLAGQAEVLCASRAPVETFDLSSEDNSLNCTNQTIIYVLDDTKLAGITILTWIPVILTLLVLSGVFAMMAIGDDMTKDTLLFRTAGRHSHQS